MRHKNTIEITQLRDVLAYDQETGLLTWRVSRGTARAGAEAGGVNGGGYRIVMVNGKNYRSHRIAWAITHNAWPSGEIDHIDGDKTNNRLSNLRDVLHCTNNQNLKRARKDNRSGSSVPGVHWHKASGKFAAQASRNGRLVHLGLFAILAEAEAAALAYRRKSYAGNTL